MSKVLSRFPWYLIKRTPRSVFCLVFVNMPPPSSSRGHLAPTLENTACSMSQALQWAHSHMLPCNSRNAWGWGCHLLYIWGTEVHSEGCCTGHRSENWQSWDLTQGFGFQVQDTKVASEWDNRRASRKALKNEMELARRLAERGVKKTEF